MDRNYQKIGLLNWIVLLAAAVGGVLVTNYANSAAGWPATLIVALGLFVAVASYFQMRLEEREGLKKLEFDELNKVKSSAALFTAEAETFPAQRSREQFEKFFIPGFTIVLLLFQVAGVIWQWKALAKPPMLAPDRGTFAMALFGLAALILFLLGKYSSGLARLEKQRLLRPGAGYLLLGAYVSFALVADVAAAIGGFPAADVILARVLCVLLALIAVETLITLLLEIYRPRVKGEPARLLYDSRLVGLLGQPEGIFRTAAQAIDYQFGFQVSQTGVYRFFEENLAKIIVVQLAVLFLSTCIVFIEPGEQALLERFGKPSAGAILEPGAHVKWFWPVEKVRRYRTRELQSFTLGIVPDKEREKTDRTVLWTVSHNKEEFNLLVASREQGSEVLTNAAEGAVPVSMLTVSIPVQYQISDVRAFAYDYADAGGLLEKISMREVVRYLVGVDLNEMMSAGRFKAAQTLRERIQEQASKLNLGVQIVFVGLQDIHPPVKVADAYEAVVGAEQEIQARILAAEGYKLKTVALAQAEGQKRIRDAEIFQLTRLAAAAARAGQFTNQITAFTASPRVYPERVYLQTFARAAEGARKYLIAPTNVHGIFQLNLEDKVRQELENIYVPEPRKLEDKK